MSRNLKLLGAAALVGGMFLASGCHSGPEEDHGPKITADYVRHHWSPELDSLTEPGKLHQVMDSRTIDTNLRQIHGDMARLLLTDRPLGLSPWVVPK